MKQIIAVKTPNTVIYRIQGKIVYLKGNQHQYTEQLTQQIKAKGGSVIYGRGWVRCDIFNNGTEYKLGKYNIDFDANLITNTESKEIKTVTLDAVENILTEFFKNTLELSGFKCEVTDVI